MKTLLQAKWIAPMCGPLIRDGAVVFEAGRIAGVGPAEAMRQQHPNATAVDAGDAVVMPGLINAHTHLEHSAQPRPPLPEGGFVAWIQLMRQRSRLDPALLPAAIESAVKAGVEQCLRFGVTTVGDISRHCALTRPLLARSPLRAVSFGEVIALGALRGQSPALIAAAADASCATGRLSIGITPHAPYTVEGGVYRQCLEAVTARNLPLATHLAETDLEAPFLAEHEGPLREMWDSLGLWDDGIERFDGGPIRYAAALGLLSHPTLLAHVNYCDNEEMAILAAGQASVVLCPRTHAYFGHPPHRWREMLAAGINVAVGTDSCASSPDLNLVDELRLLWRLAPEFPPLRLWEMATVRASRALGLEEQVGTLSRGKIADLVVFPARREQPLMEVLAEGIMPSQVWIEGKRMSG